MIKKIILSLYLSILSIFFSIIFVLNISVPIHKLFIKFTNLSPIINLSPQNIQSDYNNVINYLRFPWINDLNLKYFSMSSSGTLHFQEVKNIFSLIFISFLITLLIGIISYYFYDNVFLINIIKSFNFYFYFNISFVFIFIITLFFNFSSLFTLFHHIFFNNNYWIFNPLNDSIILILPENFFMLCALFILGSILLISFSCKLYYNKNKIFLILTIKN